MKRLKWDELIIGTKYNIMGYRIPLEYVKQDRDQAYFIQHGEKFFVENKDGLIEIVKFDSTIIYEFSDKVELKDRNITIPLSLLDEIITGIEDYETLLDARCGSHRDMEELIKDNELYQNTYHKLIEIKKQNQ